MFELKQHRQQVLDVLQQSAKRYQRDFDSIHLLAVSKTRSAEEIEQLFQAGQVCFGENYLQEALEKIQQLAQYAIEWHFIGHIQSNKTALLAENFAWIHSVSTFKIARRLSAQRPQHLPPLNVCLQVNISQEDSKSGVAPDAAVDLAEAISELPNLTMRGLMAIPEPCDDLEQQRKPYHQMQSLLTQIQALGVEVDTLSMGMSADMEAAVAEGATIVRVGTAIFGPRPAKKL